VIPSVPFDVKPADLLRAAKELDPTTVVTAHDESIERIAADCVTSDHELLRLI